MKGVPQRHEQMGVPSSSGVVRRPAPAVTGDELEAERMAARIRREAKMAARPRLWVEEEDPERARRPGELRRRRG